MKRILLFLVVAIVVALVVSKVFRTAQYKTMSQSLDQIGLPDQCRQALLMTSSSWEANRGQLTLLEREGSDAAWTLVLNKPIPVTLGRSGLAWGLGLPTEVLSTNPVKQEGDGRSVAGVFELGTGFGYAPLAPTGTRIPYRQAGDNDYFVDDPDSADYNHWVRATPGDTGVGARWKSAEPMKREDSKYELGIVVKHNMNPVEANKGSAIFLHVWGGPEQLTSGCTAMSRPHMAEVMTWLDPSLQPLLIQIPDHELSRLKLRSRSD